MPRSTSIYLVRDEKNDIIAGFTVKHELMSYLERFGVLTGLTVTRIPDGLRTRAPLILGAKELLGWA